MTNESSQNTEQPSGGFDPQLLLASLAALSRGDFSARLPAHWFGVAGEIARAFSDLVEANAKADMLLKQSKAMIEALQRSNDQLVERANQLALQNAEVGQKSRDVEQARAALEDKTDRLALASKYKSEFLANMSHELRTPLNSLLLLSKKLSENSDKNLTSRQIEYVSVINKSGNELLLLINDILDLAKIESGTVLLTMAEEPFDHVREEVRNLFTPVAEGRKLALGIQIDPDLPPTFRTDFKRLMQVLNNLLSNAFKFTEHGHVDLHIAFSNGGWSEDHATLNGAEHVLAFTVRDSGVGIPVAQQRLVFEAFQQADPGTARSYGGTGLGLSISREIAQLFKGELRLIKSNPGEGSVFTLFVPQDKLPARPVPDVHKGREHHPKVRPQVLAEMPGIADDRVSIRAEDRLVLIVEDDGDFANLLLELAHDHGFKGLIAVRGDQAISLARRHKPAAIFLDAALSGIVDSWQVLAMLKDDLTIRHLPVYVVSLEEDNARSLALGAAGFLSKPASKEAFNQTFEEIKISASGAIKNVMVVEGNAARRQAMIDVLAGDDVKINAVETVDEALALCESALFDCVVCSLTPACMNASALEKKIQEIPTLKGVPLMVYAESASSVAEAQWLEQRSESIVVKVVDSIEGLLDKTCLLLHRVIARLPTQKREILEDLHKSGALSARKILIVDDDLPSLYTLTGLLERHGVEVFPAEDGEDAIALLHETQVDAALVDVTTLETGGQETIRQIRALERFKSLPIIALTAKVMKNGGQEECVTPGASDCLRKPVEEEQLLSTLRIWVQRI